jgi:hypothetical protein
MSGRNFGPPRQPCNPRAAGVRAGFVALPPTTGEWRELLARIDAADAKGAA